MRERDGRNRPAVRDVRCHLATHASSFMPLDSVIERDMAERAWFVLSLARSRPRRRLSDRTHSRLLTHENAQALRAYVRKYVG